MAMEEPTRAWQRCRLPANQRGLLTQASRRPSARANRVLPLARPGACSLT